MVITINLLSLHVATGCTPPIQWRRQDFEGGSFLKNHGFSRSISKIIPQKCRSRTPTDRSDDAHDLFMTFVLATRGLSLNNNLSPEPEACCVGRTAT
jgi:hypothetical protein